MEDASFATRVCKILGVETIILTNAAGGLNPEYNVGDLVCLNDHLNLAGLVGFHPLRGPNLEEFGTSWSKRSSNCAWRLVSQVNEVEETLKVRHTLDQRHLSQGKGSTYGFVALVARRSAILTLHQSSKMLQSLLEIGRAHV